MLFYFAEKLQNHYISVLYMVSSWQYCYIYACYIGFYCAIYIKHRKEIENRIVEDLHNFRNSEKKFLSQKGESKDLFVILQQPEKSFCRFAA